MGTIPVGSGLAAQLVVKDEATYGVAPALTSGINSYEFKNETLELKKTAVEGEGLAAGHLYRRTKRRVVTNYDANGDIVMELPTRNLGWWLRYMIGDFSEAGPTQIATSGIYRKVFQPVSSQFSHSFTAQKGAPAVDATVEPFTYVGCKLSGWQLEVATGAIANLTLHVDGRNELGGPNNSNGDPLNATTPPLATWQAVTSGLGMSVFHFREATIFTGGTPTMGAGTKTVSAPGVPASTTPLVNTTGFNAWVTISNGTGTISSVVVNGVQVGTTAGSYYLPSNGTITLTYSAGTVTWTWVQAIVSLVGETAAGNVKSASISKAFSYDVGRIFVGTSGFKSEQIEQGYRAMTGSINVEWLSSESYYAAYAADTTTSLQLTFTGPTVGGQTYLLDVIVPSIKLEGESVKVPGPAVLTQTVNWSGYDDEATVPVQVAYQSEDITF